MKMIDNTAQWRDTSGAPVDCHEGMILQVAQTWYWYGRRYRGNDTGVYGNAGSKFRCPIVCCKSDNLVDWSPAQPILEYPTDGPYTLGTWHRPRIAFNAKTQRFVLWFFHLVVEPKPAVIPLIASAATPDGPFELEGPAVTLDNVQNGDHDIFVDRDGQGYLASGNWSWSALVAPLTPDFRATAAAPTTVFQSDPDHGARFEGYALTHYRGRYIYAASGVHGLASSETSYGLGDSPLGPFTPMGVMSKQRTWNCQISSLLHIPQTGVIMALCDRWLHDYANRPTTEALYSAQQWFPISFDPQSGKARMLPFDQWDPALSIEDLERLAPPEFFQ